MQHSHHSQASMLAGGAFLTERNRLINCIDAVVSNYSSYVVHPSKDFTRSRLNDFSTVIRAPFVLSEQSLLLSIASSSIPNVPLKGTDSAFCQSKGKIDSSAFENIFFSYYQTNTLKKKKYKGLDLRTCDGSELSVRGKAINKEDSLTGHSKHGGTRYFMYANIAYDPLNHEFTDVSFQPGSEKSERKAFLELVEHEEDNKEICWIMDRGYESLALFYILQQKGVHFVCRIKDESSKMSVVKNFDLPVSDTYDTSCEMILCSKPVAKVDAYPNKYKYVAKASSYGIFDEEHQEVALNLRLVRYKVIDDNGEHVFSVFTNLSSDEYTAEDVNQIYKLRWQCEVAYRDLKYSAGLEHIHSRSINSIKQEVYAKMTVYNMASRVSRALEKKRRRKKKKKLKHKIHFGNCIKMVMMHLFEPEGFDCDAIDLKILNLTIPIRPGRADTRKK